MTLLPTLRLSAIPFAAALALAACSLSASAQASPGEATQTASPTNQTASPTNQTAPPPTSAAPTTQPLTPQQGATVTYTRGRKKKADDDQTGKTVQSKDTKKAEQQTKKTAVAATKASAAAQPVGLAKLPDKALYDKAQDAIKHGRYDVARLDLQTMLNTYPDSQYQMRAKLAVADSWYKEGGTAALTQAESEYRDFTVFFPNQPEAAEAQMRIGDIYFKQMDKPDRDYAKALHAEEEYRRMLTDYPDAPKKLLDDARTHLREVQEVMATREANIASYYSTRENYAATIARYQTVADTYPLYSHMDDVLIGLGDAYEAEARYVRGLQPPANSNAKQLEDAKGKLEAEYDSLAAAEYRKVVLEHAAAPHVEDAKDRLAAMNLPIPTPSPAQLASSQALEDSRHQYAMSDYVRLFILHQPDTVTTATLGEPTMTDPKPVTAPQIQKHIGDDFKAAFTPVSAVTTPAAVAPVATAATAATDTAAPDTSAVPAKPLAFNNVGTDSSASTTTTLAPASPGAATTSTTGTGVSAEILTNAASTPGAKAAATGAASPNYGLPSAGPTNAQALPAIERPAEAPDQINTVSSATPAGQADPAAGRKAPKPTFDKADESSSKHKKKKGIQKVNPF